MRKIITPKQIEQFHLMLILEEKSLATAHKYARDVERFAAWLDGKPANKERVLAYKASLKEGYCAKTVNTAIAALNRFFAWKGWNSLRISSLRVQQKMFWEESRLLKKGDYLKLLEAADRLKKFRLGLVIQTICSTGIRVSELQYITVEAVQRGVSEVECKGKIRVILIPHDLKKELRKYIKKQKIESGPVFVTRNGNPLDRSNIWRDMKALCEEAGVDPNKVFPHNLRHLFARTFYEKTKDIVKLADLLGHSSVQTTRIYTLSTSKEEHRTVNELDLVVSERRRAS